MGENQSNRVAEINVETQNEINKNNGELEVHN